MKHFSFYLFTTLFLLPLVGQDTRLHAATRAETPSLGRSFLMPWKAPLAHDNAINIITTALAGLANVCSWAQPLQTRSLYLDAYKAGKRGWVWFYNVIWFVKKAIACNEIYRLGARFHPKAANGLLNPIDLGISILKIITTIGDRVIDPEVIERAGTRLFGPAFAWRSALSDHNS